MEKLRIENDLIIRNLDKFRQKLLNLVDCAELVIDCSDLQKVDMAGLQLLLAFKKNQEKSNHKIKLMNINVEVKKNIRLLGFYNLIKN